MKRLNEAEQCFLDDVREKKKTASGVHHKTGKRGYVGKMLFPTDFMSRKEKYNHRKAGKILTSNLYDTILTIDEFNQLETFEKRNRLSYWRSKYPNTEIMKAMGVLNGKYYGIVAELGLPRSPRTNSGEKKSKRKATAKAIAIGQAEFKIEDYTIQANEPVQIAPIGTATQINEAPAPVQEIIINGLHLVYNGTFSPDQIVKQFLKFGALLEDEKDDFYIELKIVQKSKEEN